jgi:hypothetical protein
MCGLSFDLIIFKYILFDHATPQQLNTSFRFNAYIDVNKPHNCLLILVLVVPILLLQKRYITLTNKQLISRCDEDGWM